MPTTSEAVRLGTLNTIHALRWVRHAAVAVCVWLWSTLLYLAKHKGSKLELIQRDVQQLEKLPLHLALVVNERDLSYCDLAKIVNWCFCVGIQYVTLYDPRGSLRSDLESLQSAMEQQHKSLFSDECEPFILMNSDNYQESPPSNGLIICDCHVISFAESTAHQLHWGTAGVHRVQVLGPSDGRQQLTGVARSLCEQVQQHRLTSRDVDINLLNNRLIGSNGGFPEPSLAVVVGPPPSLLGYLPWHTRLTEIVFISSHHKITYQQFHSLLQRYAGTTQRFGK